MTFFTPLLNLDMDKPRRWLKIEKLRIKSISQKELRKYFGINYREFDSEGSLTRLVPAGSRGSWALDFWPLNEIQRIMLFGCKYAFVSTLDHDEHIDEVKRVLNAIRLLKINGITCPVTIKDTPPNEICSHVSFIHPLESKLKEKTVLSQSEINKIRDIYQYLPRVSREDIELLKSVIEHGISSLSLVFLVMIIERAIMEGDKGEISFKVRVYGSKLLSKYFGYDGREAFKILGKAYGLRSGFVHKGKVSDDKVQQILPKLYDYASKILLIKAKDSHVLKKEKRKMLLFSVQ
jgi:hypothetical protein